MSLNALPYAARQLQDDEPQRERVEQSLLAVLVYGVFAAAHEFEAALGLLDSTAVRMLSGATLGGGLLFYLFVRCGLNQKFLKGSAVARLQCIFGVLAVCAAYAVNTPARGSVLLIMLVILVFGMFALAPREARGIGIFALALLAAVMLWFERLAPGAREPAVEAMHFLFACIGVGTVLVLADRLSHMRCQMLTQKHELELALGRIYKLAISDELTGLVNRRHMNARFESEIARHERNGETLAVALLDIDHFKRINDQYGHWVGDAVLKTFACMGTDALRSTDVMARWGGEEFLLLLPTTSQPAAMAVIERLRVALQLDPASAERPELRVTFSAGLTELSAGDTPQSLIERADLAMYQAKQQGRNRTMVFRRGGEEAAASTSRP